MKSQAGIAQSFSYQLEDIQWPTKLGLGALISLVPILNLAVAGYQVAIIRNVVAEAAQPLPHWDDFGRKFIDGLILAIAGLVYALPIFLLVGVPLTVLILTGAMSQSSSQDLGSSIGGVRILAAICILGLMLVYSLLLSLIRPVILVLFAREGTLTSCFRLGEIVRIVRHYPGPFARTWIAIILAGIAIGLVVGFLNLVAGWVPCLGWVAGLLLAGASAVYILTVDAHLIGQLARLVLAGGDRSTAAA